VLDGPGLRSGRLRREQWIGGRHVAAQAHAARPHLPWSIDEGAVRRWRKERLDTGSSAARPFGPVTVAKAYRLLHAIFETAADDQMVRRNPCRIEGAGKEDSPERQVVSLPVVFAIADALPVRYRAMALLATFASLRWGELVGLRPGEHRFGRVRDPDCRDDGRAGPRRPAARDS